ncbi:ComEA family DNA-binding protein [Actinocrispum wychmicini]|uniref:ComEA family DNA-binding protein n=1 Tax=Actinocrispum wychmicini TaxID=1213861 RepID=UPI001047BF61|nr:ComEA family DNA-binding protein [Actinocrispum wychmicini]
MFDTLRRRAAQAGIPSARLRELVTTPLTRDEEWVDETPPEAPRSRLSRRRLTIVLGAVVVAACCAVLGLLLSRPERESPPPLPAAVATVRGRAPASTPGPSSTSVPAPATLVVSVVGHVPTPGLVTVTEGARVADAVRAAGGASDVDTVPLNMARRLADGEQVYVGIPAAPDVVTPQPRPGKVDLNAANVSQLDDLPGVGAVTAQRIVEWRTRHGRFATVEQLRQVDGIGDSKFTRLKDLVTAR